MTFNPGDLVVSKGNFIISSMINITEEAWSFSFSRINDDRTIRTPSAPIVVVSRLQDVIYVISSEAIGWERQHRFRALSND